MKKILLSICAVILIIEEWLWDVLSAFGHYLVVRLGLVRFENWLMQTTPYQALFAISIPILLVTPLNFFAIWLLANGLILQGISLELFAKLLGTIFIARFFTLSKPQLLTFRLIAALYNTISAWLQCAQDKITETAVYRIAKKFKAEVKARWAVWFNAK